MTMFVSVVLGIVGVTLLGGAITKVGERDAFAATLRRLPATRDAVEFFGAAVPAVEVVLALSLMLGRSVRWSAAISAALFVGFTAATRYLRGIDCGCGPFVPRGGHRVVFTTASALALLVVAIREPTLSREARLLAASTWLVCMFTIRMLRSNRSALRTLSFLEGQSGIRA